MNLFRRREKVAVNELDALPGLQPLQDDVFLYLLERALQGHLPVFYAAVPFSLVVPFDHDYDPSRHPVRETAIQDVMANWRAGQFAPMWVYPSVDRYVVSDDYITLAAARRGAPDFVPCWILGDPTVSGCEDVQGPIAVNELRRLLGFG